jgi:FkbM family methyltransferase
MASIDSVLQPLGLMSLKPVFVEEDLTSVELLLSMGERLESNLVEVGIPTSQANRIARQIKMPKPPAAQPPVQQPRQPPIKSPVQPPTQPPAQPPPTQQQQQSLQPPITMRQISTILQQQKEQVEALQRQVPSLEATFHRMKALGAVISTVLDIGACRGDWTRAARKSLPDAAFTLVEPIEYPELLAADLRGCAVHHALLYRHECEVDWYSLRNTGDSIYKERTQAYAGVEPRRRSATTLEALLGARASFDLIKLDVQGAEIDVMKGGEALVHRAAFVLLEVPFMGQYNAGAASFLQVIAYMDSLGFVPFDVPELHREVCVLLQMDIVFVRRDHPVAAQAQRAIESFVVLPESNQPAGGAAERP